MKALLGYWRVWRLHRRQVAACKALSEAFGLEARMRHHNSPWGMLDREDTRRVAEQWAAQAGRTIDMAFVRAIYNPSISP